MPAANIYEYNEISACYTLAANCFLWRNFRIADAQLQNMYISTIQVQEQGDDPLYVSFQTCTQDLSTPTLDKAKSHVDINLYSRELYEFTSTRHPMITHDLSTSTVHFTTDVFKQSTIQSNSCLMSLLFIIICIFRLGLYYQFSSFTISYWR